MANDNMEDSRLMLEEGESLVWAGKPGKTSLPVATCIGYWILGAVLALAAVAPELVQGCEWVKGLPADLVDFLAGSLAKTVFCLLATGFLLYPFIIRFVLTGKRYTVTSQRIVEDDTTYWYRDLQHVGEYVCKHYRGQE